MRIGYPCINRGLECRGAKTFRLKNYSEKRLIETVKNNLECLDNILDFNRKNEILFFRISSDIVPFASHPVCEFDWRTHFSAEFRSVGHFVRANEMRISMHPDQFIVLNAKRSAVVKNSVRELAYHADVMDAMGLGKKQKIQLHIGGMYGDKKASMARFVKRYEELPIGVKKRLVIENDDRIYNIADCLDISGRTGVPVLFDYFHHRLNPSETEFKEALKLVKRTWRSRDGIPMVDYSSRRKYGSPKGHAESIDMGDFKRFLKRSRPYDMDVMLEIKDKEMSALRAVKLARMDKRFLVHR